MIKELTNEEIEYKLWQLLYILPLVAVAFVVGAFLGILYYAIPILAVWSVCGAIAGFMLGAIKR